MFDYLFFGTLLLWYKDKDSLQKILTTLNWICGILYARMKTSQYYSILQNNLLQLPNHPRLIHPIQIFALKENGTLQSIDKNNVKDFDAKLFYTKIQLQSTEKVLVFNDKNTLLNNYESLVHLAEKHNETFSNIMEATIKDHDILPILKKYTSNHLYYKDITGYCLKAGDLYDFESDRFLFSESEELCILQMNLESKSFKKEDELD